jgi:DNA-binding Lrp family transcriptional regulator
MQVNVIPKAIVFINTPSDQRRSSKDLESMEGISEAHSSRGMYEAVAIVQAESFNMAKEIVKKHIRTLENVKSTYFDLY